jgi:Flp pilus assembly protein TadG
MSQLLPCRAIRGHSRSGGQALVEFALVAPILFLLFFGIIEFGRFVLAYEELNNATREGARYAIVHGSASTCPSGPMPGGATSPSSCADPTGLKVKSAVVRSAISLNVTNSQVTVTWPDVDNAREHDVEVVATYEFKTIIPLPIPPISMTARSTLVINH